MKLLLSPAKSLNETSDFPTLLYSEPDFLADSKKIHRVIKKLKPAQLADLMDISPKLAELNWQRNQEWHTPFDLTNARPAIFTFDGDVYDGLQAASLKESAYEQLNNQVRILSGLYGLIKPFDLMQPYRLEMGTSLAVGASVNLYQFWKKTITKSLAASLQNEEAIVNLASQEYAKAIDFKSIKNRIITIDFKDLKEGQLKTIGFFAKRARGMMVRYALDHQILEPEGLQLFDLENYRFDASLSTQSNWVFTR
ncbi:MAG: hypothetical protein CFE24_00245 [Flavobacterium sp. BFFFF2]|nr:MAG: hypothetical protein CFE24_00245 [Flavobacterium sp. BFFFF2]